MEPTDRQSLRKQCREWRDHAPRRTLASGRRIIAVTDSSFVAIDLLNAVRHRLCTITRQRHDATDAVKERC